MVFCCVVATLEAYQVGVGPQIHSVICIMKAVMKKKAEKSVIIYSELSVRAHPARVAAAFFFFRAEGDPVRPSFCLV